MCLMFSIEEAIKPIYVNYMVCGMPRAIVERHLLEVNANNYFIESRHAVWSNENLNDKEIFGLLKIQQGPLGGLTTAVSVFVNSTTITTNIETAGILRKKLLFFLGIAINYSHACSRIQLIHCFLKFSPLRMDNYLGRVVGEVAHAGEHKP